MILPCWNFLCFIHLPSSFQVKSLWEERAARISEARLNSRAIGDELRELREWMRDPEGRLSRPVSVRDTSDKEYKKKRKEYQASPGQRGAKRGQKKCCKKEVAHLILYQFSKPKDHFSVFQFCVTFCYSCATNYT